MAGVVCVSRPQSPFNISLHLGESFRNNWPLKPFRALLQGLCLQPMKVGGGEAGEGRDAVRTAIARGARTLRPWGWRGMIGWDTEPSCGAQEPVGCRNAPRKTLARSGAVLSIDDAVSWPCRHWKQLEMLSAGSWEVFGSLTPVQKGLSLAAGIFGLNCVKR